MDTSSDQNPSQHRAIPWPVAHPCYQAISTLWQELTACSALLFLLHATHKKKKTNKNNTISKGRFTMADKRRQGQGLPVASVLQPGPHHYTMGRPVLSSAIEPSRQSERMFSVFVQPEVSKES